MNNTPKLIPVLSGPVPMEELRVGEHFAWAASYYSADDNLYRVTKIRSDGIEDVRIYSGDMFPNVETFFLFDVESNALFYHVTFTV